jgi:hypothetical protein
MGDAKRESEHLLALFIGLGGLHYVDRSLPYAFSARYAT